MGVYLSTPVTEKVGECGANEVISYGCCAMQGWRKTMEDAHLAMLDFHERIGEDAQEACGRGESEEKWHLFGVFDGHGGAEVAMFCKKHLPSCILTAPEIKERDFEGALTRAFLALDEMLMTDAGRRELRENNAIVRARQQQGNGGNRNGGGADGSSNSSGAAASDWDEDNEDGSPVGTPKAGCTAVVGLIVGKMMYVANVGDSRCVLSRKGQAEELSEDHKPNSPDEMKRVINAGGFVGNGRINGTLNLSRAIGDLEFKQNKDLKPEDQMVTAKPDIRNIELCEDDEFVVLACDGIWDCMTSQEAIDFVGEKLISGVNPQQTCEELFDKCLAPDCGPGGVGCDNMTAVVVVFEPTGLKKLIRKSS